MFISFLGAAREVTGSCNLLEVGGKKVLIDCGMFQGSEFNEKKNHDPLPFNPKEIFSVIVTHSHLDHIGRLPVLVKGGFVGPIYATPATIRLTELVLKDAVEVMAYNERHFGEPVLFEELDIFPVIQQFKPINYHEAANLFSNINFRFHDAGHIFGSSFVFLQGENKKIIFSGDIGNVEVPIVRDTEIFPSDIDAVVCESTYGGRLHESTMQRQEIIEKMVSEAIKRGGVLMIPSFSIERTQELLYVLNELIDRKHILPRVPIFLDSPLAIGATKIFREYPGNYDEEAEKLFNDGDDLFQFPGLTMCETKEESKKINMTPGPKIIIAGAGMMNGGRIVHHALRYLSDERNTLLIVGYQAAGTLGRKILDGESPVKILGESVQVRCQIKAIGALSAHGDQEKLMDWLGGGSSAPKKVYINHGEPLQSEALATRLTNELGIKSTVVNFGLRVEV